MTLNTNLQHFSTAAELEELISSKENVMDYLNGVDPDKNFYLLSKLYIPSHCSISMKPDFFAF